MSCHSDIPPLANPQPALPSLPLDPIASALPVEPAFPVLSALPSEPALPIVCDCVPGSPSDALAPFDFAVIRYRWDTGGRDLDTRTALINTGGIYDGVDLGWSRGTASGTYLRWAGDNTGNPGAEAVAVDFPQLAVGYPALVTIDIRLRAFWYGDRYSGDFIIEFQTFLGGAMQQSGTDWVNVGGALVQTLSVDRNSVTQQSLDINGDPMGVLRYTVATKTGEILLP